MESFEHANLLFSGGTALAGLILVFLGGILNTYELFDAQQKPAVRNTFRRRAVICYIGFLFAILSALTALAWTRMSIQFLGTLSIISILISFGFVVALATLAVKEV